MSQKQIHVLLIEDNSEDARLIQEMLAEASLAMFNIKRVSRVSGGLEALTKEEFDVVLSDLHLPDAHELEVVDKVSALHPSVPLIVMSATYDEALLGLEACRKGASDYIAKNYLSSQLLSRSLLYTIERKQMEKQIFLQSNCLNVVANAVVITDSAGHIQWVNPAFTALTGYVLEEMIGKTPRILKSGKQNQSFYQDLWHTILAGEIWHGEFINKKKNGDLYDHETTITPFCNHAGVITHLIGISQDVTARKRAEAQLLQMMDAKSEFISIVSHELRTPLTAIKESVSIVRDGMAGQVSSEQLDYLDIAQRNVDRLARLVNNVLDLQKLEATGGESGFAIAQNDLNETVKQTTDSYELVAKNKGLALLTDLAPDVPRLNFDKDKITQVLTNLINNALKFSEKGKIVVRTKRGGNSVQVSVEDEGPGIREEDYSKLFKTFSQLSSGMGRQTGGTGLGLAISKKIIDAHHGKIGVESVVGRGSTFYFILPIVERRKI